MMSLRTPALVDPAVGPATGAQAARGGGGHRAAAFAELMRDARAEVRDRPTETRARTSDRARATNNGETSQPQEATTGLVGAGGSSPGERTGATTGTDATGPAEPVTVVVERPMTATVAATPPTAPPVGTAPGVGEPIDTESIDTAVGSPAPGSTAPIGTTAGSTAPIGTAPIGTAPIGTAPIGTAPGSTAPGSTATSSAAPVSPATSSSTPVGTTPTEATSVAGAPAATGAATTGGTATGATPTGDLAGPAPAAGSEAAGGDNVGGAGSGEQTFPAAPTTPVGPAPTAGASTGADAAATQVGTTASAGVVQGTSPGTTAAPTPEARQPIGPFGLDQMQSAARAVGARLEALQAGEVHRLVLHLNPAELGPVRVTAESVNGTVQISLAGGTESAREALRGAMDDLRSLLADTGPSGGDRSGAREHGERPSAPVRQHVPDPPPSWSVPAAGRSPAAGPGRVDLRA